MLVVLGVVLVATPAEATLMRALSFADLMSRAEQVALVTCTGEQVSRDGSRRIVTDYALTVEEAVRGPAAVGATLTMRSLGGAIGDLGMRIEGEPRLEVGQRYLVFVEHRAGALRSVGMSQGVLPVDEDPRGALQVHPGGAGLSLVQQTRGALTPSPGALLSVEPWERLRERLEAIPPGATAP